MGSAMGVLLVCCFITSVNVVVVDVEPSLFCLSDKLVAADELLLDDLGVDVLLKSSSLQAIENMLLIIKVFLALKIIPYQLDFSAWILLARSFLRIGSDPVKVTIHIVDDIIVTSRLVVIIVWY